MLLGHRSHAFEEGVRVGVVVGAAEHFGDPGRRTGGYGNMIGIGAGSSGCDVIIVPGAMIWARARIAGGRNPSSADSAALIWPTTSNAALLVMSRSTPDGLLLGADEDHAEAAAAGGDVDEQALDRRAALTRGVLVELVEHDERVALGGRVLVLGPDLGEHRGDDEPLRVGVQRVHVDDGQLGGEVDLGQPGSERDGAAAGSPSTAGGRTPASGCVVHTAAPCRVEGRAAVGHLAGDELDEVVEGLGDDAGVRRQGLLETEGAQCRLPGRARPGRVAGSGR